MTLTDRVRTVRWDIRPASMTSWLVRAASASSATTLDEGDDRGTGDRSVVSGCTVDDIYVRKRIANGEVDLIQDDCRADTSQ